MPTELLRRGDELTLVIHTPVVNQGDGATRDDTLGAITCINGCGVPMQPVDRESMAFRCSACDEITVDRAKLDAAIGEATSALDRGLFGLMSIQTFIAGLAMTGNRVDHATLLTEIGKVITAMTSAPVEAHADIVHADAIDWAARICMRRSDSLFTDSKNAIAANEAAKCAFAIRRIRSRESIDLRLQARREEASAQLPTAPEAAHA